MTGGTTRYGVRAAVAGDAERLGHVHTQAWREAYGSVMPAAYLAALDAGASAKRWRDALLAPDSTRAVVVATADDQVVGFAVTGPTRDDPPDPAVELYAIYVLADHHGSGLAPLLLSAALRPAAGEPVSLWVVATNDRALAFYARHGFVPDGRTKRHEGTGVGEVRMVCPTLALRS